MVLKFACINIPERKKNFSKNKAVLYKKSYTEDEVRDGEVAISIYKQRDLFLNETELENYNKKLDKIYNNPYRYSYLKNSDAKDIDKDSDEYYEIVKKIQKV